MKQITNTETSYDDLVFEDLEGVFLLLRFHNCEKIPVERISLVCVLCVVCVLYVLCVYFMCCVCTL